jgi:hypothetical protein
MRNSRSTTRRFASRRQARLRVVMSVAVLCALGGGLASTDSLLASGNVTSATAPLATSLLPTAGVPAVTAASDPDSVELGVKFAPDVDGYATGLRFYKGATNLGTHVGTLWSSTGTVLARLTFTGESASGWQVATFPTPVALSTTQQYVVSYHAPLGHYAYTYHYFDNRTDNGALHAFSAAEANGNGVYSYGTTPAFPTFAAPSAANYWVDVTFGTTTTAPTTVSTAAPTTTVAPAPTTTTIKAATTTTTVPAKTGFPDASNTGVPAGVVLSGYTGSMTITSCGAVIDSKVVNGDLTILAGNGTRSAATPCVTIRNSLIKGEVHNGYAGQGHGPLVLTDDEIAVPIPNNGASAALDEANFYGWRLNIHNARSNVMCDGFCGLHDSFVHDNYYVNSAHMGGFLTNGNYGNPILLDHNTIHCDIVNPAAANNNGGCSGDMNFFGDFSAISNITATNNQLIGSSDPSYCAYTGANQSAKPYPVGTNIVWKNNVWQRGVTGKCGWAGAVFDWQNNSGNDWCSNTWDDGTAVLPGVPCVKP